MRTPDSSWDTTRNGERSKHGIRPVRITLLGSFRVAIGSRTIGEDRWRLRKAAAVVKLLALAPNHRLHCEQLMHLLWPRLRREAAANNLRRTLHSARRAFEADPQSAACYLGRRNEQLALCPEGPLWVDVDAFEESATAARRTREPAAYWAALDLYSGDLLPEDRYAEWAEARREQLRKTYLALLTEVADLQGEGGRSTSKTGAMLRLSLDPSAVPVRAPLTPDEPVSELTGRQREVAVLVARGMTNRRIAAKLGVSERTVDAHLRKVFAKLGLCSRVQLATWTSEHGWLGEDRG